jgi:hypothetical protein
MAYFQSFVHGPVPVRLRSIYGPFTVRFRFVFGASSKAVLVLFVVGVDLVLVWTLICR